jgi:hypothetical protein
LERALFTIVLPFGLFTFLELCRLSRRIVLHTALLLPFSPLIPMLRIQETGARVYFLSRVTDITLPDGTPAHYTEGYQDWLRPEEP